MARGLGFKLFGIPVMVDPFFLAFAAFLGFLSQRNGLLLVAWVVIVFVGVLWHEMGHALAFRAFGYKSQISLQGLGGLTGQIVPEAIAPKRDILISLAGPAAGLILGGTVLALRLFGGVGTRVYSVGSAQTAQIINDLLFVNIGWSVFNLMPMLPLDGGRVMSAVVAMATKGRNQTLPLIISLGVGCAVAAAAYLVHLQFAALLVLLFSLTNFQALQAVRKRKPLEDHIAALREGYQALDRRDHATAAAAATKVLETPQSDEIKASATNLLMWAHMREEEFEAAALSGMDAFQTQPSPGLAYHIATAWSRAGKPDEAIRWLTKAVDAGFNNLEEIEGDPNLAPLRDSFEYQKIKLKLQTGATQSPPSTGQAPNPSAKPGSGMLVKAILLINAVVFIAQQLDPQLTLRFAESPVAIARGQWYRLLTPILMHANIPHIAFNSYAAWIYGPTIERVFGKVRFLAIYAIAGFTGAVASYVLQRCNGLGLGASGAIFGLIGALLMYFLIRRKESSGSPQGLQGILFIIGLNLVIGFSSGGLIDNFAHLGGLAGGMVVGGSFDLLQRARAKGKLRPATALTAQFLAAAAATGLAVGVALYHTAHFTCGPSF